MIEGIGVDIVEIKRIKLAMAPKMLTLEELASFHEITHEDVKKQYLASRFAAKEAIIKATKKKFLLKEIILKNNENGELQSNIDGIKISISHEQKYCIAFAIYSKI